MLMAQFEAGPLKEKTAVALNKNLQKGTQHIALQGLSFGWGYGRVIGSVGFRYGYFIADKNLLFISADFESYGSAYFSSKVGINYRRYFTDYKVKPFAQIGINRGWDDHYGEKSTFWELSMAGGAAVQVKRFSFELGMQLDVSGNVRLSPIVGVSYSF